MKIKITASIAGQEYTMVAEEAENYVKRCAELVDAQVRGVMSGGHLGRSDAAVLAAAVMSFPLMVRAIRLALEGVDVKLEQAARTLGASRWRVFLTITLPLTLPGIIVGTVLAFARSLGEFGATITFVSNIPGETRTLPSAMYTLIQTPGGEGVAARLCLIAIGLALVSLLISEWLARVSRQRMGG